jgi:hypothetical protein
MCPELQPGDRLTKEREYTEAGVSAQKQAFAGGGLSDGAKQAVVDAGKALESVTGYPTATRVESDR